MDPAPDYTKLATFDPDPDDQASTSATASNFPTASGNVLLTENTCSYSFTPPGMFSSEKFVICQRGRSKEVLFPFLPPFALKL